RFHSSLCVEFNVSLCSFADVGMAHGSALEFNKMIKAATGKCALFSYYGCYCGLGGKETTLDAETHTWQYIRTHTNHCGGIT
uniref:Phospholipase A(2) n=1 Tax=Chelydra serpentina TaxID=8475 RepID=A0A8C3SXA2_CHESE